jgi:hypothetical protein
MSTSAHLDEDLVLGLLSYLWLYHGMINQSFARQCCTSEGLKVEFPFMMSVFFVTKIWVAVTMKDLSRVWLHFGSMKLFLLCSKLRS